VSHCDVQVTFGDSEGQAQVSIASANPLRPIEIAADHMTVSTIRRVACR
jgi:hypothetical protein